MRIFSPKHPPDLVDEGNACPTWLENRPGGGSKFIWGDILWPMPKIGADVNQILSNCCDLKPLPTSVGKAAAMDLLSPLSANQTHTRAHTYKKRKHTNYSHYTYCNPAEFKHHPFLGVVVLVVFRTSAKGYKTADIMTVPEQADNTASSAFAKLPLNQLDPSKSTPAKINWCMIEIRGWAHLKSDHHSRCIEKLGVKCRQRFGLFFIRN